MSSDARSGSAPSGPLPAGVPAPDFTLHSTPDQTVSLHEFRGQPVILAFYPADWSPVCGDQMALYNEILPEFERYGAELLGISVDGVWCHTAFAHDRHLRFPLLSDFEPKGAVARTYGVYRGQEGTSERALFVIDAEGIIRWSHVSPVGERDHVQGPATAPVTLVEYGDYECPYCGAAYPSVKEVQRRLGDRLRFVFRNFPLTQAHPHAERAAEAAEAAGAQGKFWEMHDTLYENQQALEDDDLVGYAEAIGLDAERFARDLADGAYAERVRADFLGGVRSGVNGTPTFFVNGIRHDDGYDPETLLAALRDAGA